MKKTIIICGLIAGFIVTSWFLLAMSGIFTVSNHGSLLLGYTSMLVAFSLIFVAIKNYRDNHEGTVTFGRAFRIGLWITLIASTIYVAVWMIDYYFFIPDYFEKYSAHLLAGMKAKGASQAEIQAQAAQLKSYGTMYKNPFFNAMMTYIEILPVGLVVSILAAVILKRKLPSDDINIANA